MTLIVDAHQHVRELGDSLSWDGTDDPQSGIQGCCIDSKWMWPTLERVLGA